MIYLLVLKVPELSIEVGALGKLSFEKGIYAYVGSAPSEARIKRHLKKEKRLKWHIDYLTARKDVEAIAIFRIEARKEHEAKLAKELSKYFSFVPGFGSTDSTARSHLFKVSLGKLKEVVSRYCKRNKLSFSLELL